MTIATPTVAITSSDPLATLPANAPLVSGTRTFTVTLATATSQTITATDVAAVADGRHERPGPGPWHHPVRAALDRPRLGLPGPDRDLGRLPRELAVDRDRQTHHGGPDRRRVRRCRRTRSRPRDITLILTNGTTDTVVGPLSTAQDVAPITSAVRQPAHQAPDARPVGGRGHLYRLAPVRRRRALSLRVRACAAAAGPAAPVP